MSKENQRKGMVIKIAVPVVILMIVAGIFLLKNAEPTEQVKTPEGSEGSDFDLHVTEVIDLEQLKSYGLPIIIDFGADDCAPCKEMAPVLEELNEELRGKAIIKFVDVWKNPQFAEGYPVSAIPTQFFFNADGTPFNPEKSMGIRLNRYEDAQTGERTLTAHVGGLTKQQLLDLLAEMGMQ